MPTPNATSAPAGGTATAPAVAVPETQPQVLTPELVARRGDARMARLIAERDQEQQTLSRLLASYGQSHPAVRPAVIALGVTQDAIAELLLQYQAAATQPATQTLPGASAAVDDPAAVTAGVARKQAEFRVAELKARSEKAKTELLDIGRKELQIRNLKSEIDAVQKNLDEAKARIDQLGVESLVSGRTTTLSTGDIPFRPAKKRNLATVPAALLRTVLRPSPANPSIAAPTPTDPPAAPLETGAPWPSPPFARRGWLKSVGSSGA